jgi:hypothetical protein
MTVQKPDLPALLDDCGNCAGLCCIAYPFDDPDYFATDKDTDDVCENLDCGFGCGIHAQLIDRGFPGCVSYSCAGAGQRVTQVIFKGQTWRDQPELLEQMTYALRVLRPIHEALMLLNEAQSLPVPQQLLDYGTSLMHDMCPADPRDITDFEAPEVQSALAGVPIYLRSLGLHLNQ